MDKTAPKTTPFNPTPELLGVTEGFFVWLAVLGSLLWSSFFDILDLKLEKNWISIYHKCFSRDAKQISSYSEKKNYLKENINT